MRRRGVLHHGTIVFRHHHLDGKGQFGAVWLPHVRVGHRVAESLRRKDRHRRAAQRPRRRVEVKTGWQRRRQRIGQRSVAAPSHRQQHRIDGFVARQNEVRNANANELRVRVQQRRQARSDRFLARPQRVHRPQLEPIRRLLREPLNRVPRRVRPAARNVRPFAVPATVPIGVLPSRDGQAAVPVRGPREREVRQARHNHQPRRRRWRSRRHRRFRLRRLLPGAERRHRPHLEPIRRAVGEPRCHVLGCGRAAARNLLPRTVAAAAPNRILPAQDRSSAIAVRAPGDAHLSVARQHLRLGRRQGHGGWRRQSSLRRLVSRSQRVYCPHLEAIRGAVHQPFDYMAGGVRPGIGHVDPIAESAIARLGVLPAGDGRAAVAV